MTAPIGTTANRFTGMREAGQVTNTYGGYFVTGAGTTVTIALPFYPDKFEWWNYTDFGTDTKNLNGVWFRDFPSGDNLIITRGTTTLTSTLETTNGITDASLTGGFANQHLTITNITGPATPPVITTSANHNLSDNDRVVITQVVGTMSEVINNNTYVVQVLSATTFALYDTFGLPIVISGAYTSGGQVTKVSPALGDVNQPTSAAYPVSAIIDYPPVYQLTLGTSIIVTGGKKFYFQATQFNDYVNLGTQA